MPMLERSDLAEKLPLPLKPLLDLAGNLRWSWHAPAMRVFERMDPEVWQATRGNPVMHLRRLPAERLVALAQDGDFLKALAEAGRDLERYLKRPTWFELEHKDASHLNVAYFSAEFGVASCLPIYSGGLGILAGDHLRAASDLGIPLVGIGLAYRSGYFRQVMDPSGWQTEAYDDHDFENLPVNLVRDAEGAPETVSLVFPEGRVVQLRIWRAQVGRVPLFLLDADLPENDPRDREITHYLYGGDSDMRLRQEILLGIGGVRALNLTGNGSRVFHLNEGHSAFLILERIRETMATGLDFEAARQRVAATSIFTTHTPEPAGFDHFAPDLLWRYLQSYLDELGVTFERFLSLGTVSQPDGYRPLNMALLALRNTTYRNGVSRLHGQVARAMWRNEWPQEPEERIPIGSVTNGVHLESWISPEIGALLDHRLGPGWREGELPLEAWNRLLDVPPAEIWGAHRAAKQRLVEAARRRLRDTWMRSGREEDAERVKDLFDPEKLLIGFARRFAPYKRATLILRDRGRLGALLENPERPVQFLFSGKAHPQNQEGKHLIQEVIGFAREVGHHIAFLEDYDIEIARLLVQGVDVWLNTPRRPQEASGTSGMKAAINGVPNVSILDGWWAEAYRPEVGWAIGNGESDPDHGAQDEREARLLYEILENAVIPTYYDRGPDGFPERWTLMMRDSLRLLAPVYNTHRMVREYTDRYYLAAGSAIS